VPPRDGVPLEVAGSAALDSARATAAILAARPLAPAADPAGEKRLNGWSRRLADLAPVLGSRAATVRAGSNRLTRKGLILMTNGSTFEKDGTVLEEHGTGRASNHDPLRRRGASATVAAGHGTGYPDPGARPNGLVRPFY
jgi:hypothetical protein